MIVGVVGPRESCVIIRKALQQIDQSHEVRLYTRELVREAVMSLIPASRSATA